MEPASPENPFPRGLLRVGGATLARHQLALALGAGCGRIACHARGIVPELIELQREAEKAGASFHVVSGAHGLSGLVTAADEVLVLAEGLLPTAGDALRLLSGGGATVFVQPAESGIPAGFERIDINHASAGLLLVPGRLVDRLMELPVDADPASALLRIALQAGVAQRSVPEDVRLGSRWLLVRSEQEAHAAEEGWMVRHTADGLHTPGPLLARALVRHFGPALLHGGNSSLIGAATSALLAGIGLALAWFGWAALGYGLLGAGWVLQRASAMLERLRHDALAQRPAGALRDRMLSASFDIVLIAMLVASIPPLPGQTGMERCFAPLVLMGLLRLLARMVEGAWGRWCEDRFALCLLIAALALGKVLAPGIMALSVLLILAGIVLPRDGESALRLTRA